MDLGLDEIIKTKFKKGFPGARAKNGPRNKGRRQEANGKAFPRGGGGRAPGGGKTPIIDARAKIIARKRKTLRDAREKLNALHRQKDARTKLTGGNFNSRLGAIGSAILLGDSVPRRTIANSGRTPRPVMDTFPFEQNRGRARQRDRIYRTIDNDNDLMMETDRSWDPNRLPQLEVRLTRPAAPPLAYSRPRELRTPREDSWLKPSPILRRDDSIKSRLEPLRQEEGYRIVVSNLQPTVTHEDIKELFEDIGPLLGSRVVRPGTAEVVYREIKDAVAAVDTYHNRQLDGQPMKCLLVKPSTSGSKGMMGTKGSVIPDISTIHKALFMK